MGESKAMDIGHSGITIAYEQHGSPTNPTVLLVMGIAAQLVHWPPGFVRALVERDLHVVCFDNRDSGHSTHWGHAAPADLSAALQGDLSSAPYTLSDMAGDAIGLLDALKIGAVHVVGASMGGAIAQSIAIKYPQRVLSLTSMMSTTGDASVGQPHAETVSAVFSGPAVRTRDEAVTESTRFQ